MKNPYDHDQESEDKSEANRWFARTIEKSLWRNKVSDFYVLILDGANCRTANYLKHRANLKRDEIVIIEKDPETCAIQERNGFCSFNSNVDDFNFDDKIGTFKNCVGLYFDFCGTVEKQGPGALNLLKKIKFAEGLEIPIAFTFCKRGTSEFEVLFEQFFFDLLVCMSSLGFHLSKRQDVSYRAKTDSCAMFNTRMLFKRHFYSTTIAISNEKRKKQPRKIQTYSSRVIKRKSMNTKTWWEKGGAFNREIRKIMKSKSTRNKIY